MTRTLTAGQQILPEQLLLLYLNEDSCITNSIQANYFLIAATLAELNLCGCLKFGEDASICAVDTTPLHHEVADAVLEFICSRDIIEMRRRFSSMKLMDDLCLWIELLQRDLLAIGSWHSHGVNQFWQLVARSLSKQGILSEKENRGWLFKNKIYKIIDISAKLKLQSALTEAVLRGVKSDIRMMHLLSLVYESDELSVSENLRSCYMKVVAPNESVKWKERYDVLPGATASVKKISAAAARMTLMAEQRSLVMPPELHG